jgi:signal transduction histidine kinase
MRLEALRRWIRPTGLVPRLAGFFLLLAVPTLVVVDTLVLRFELNELQEAIERGLLDQALAATATEVEAALAQPDPSAGKLAATLALYELVDRLKRPGEVFPRSAAFVLTELDPEPVALVLRDAAGRVLAEAPAAHARARDGARVSHRSAVPVGAGELTLTIDLAQPWVRALARWTLEWPILLLVGAVFGIGGGLLLALYVTGRVRRLTRVTRAWAEGDFTPLKDPNRDELGDLSRELDDTALRLQALLAARSALAVREERARVARDLHDVVKQRAFALSLHLGAMGAWLARDPAKAAERLSSAVDVCAELQRGLADTIFDLRGALPEGELGAILAQRARALAELAGVPVEVEVERLPELPEATAADLILMVEEALTNAARHARARGWWLKAGATDAMLSVEIGDDGLGYDPLRTTTGQGLRSLLARAAALGGRVELASAPGAGSRVRILLPLAGASAYAAAPAESVRAR